MLKEVVMAVEKGNSHSLLLGYVFWIFGFMGAHRFYYGKRVSGTIYFFTLGLLGVGWIVDLFLMPGLDRDADNEFMEGDYDYNLSWILLIFLGIFGAHRLYMKKYFTAILYFFTGGLFVFGWLYDLLTLNQQLNELNQNSSVLISKN
jgi:TM2 domain-containing membrane protein YozV